MTEQLHFHFHALEKEMATHSCSCLENPRDGGAWWAAVSGVALKRLSSSSSNSVLDAGLARLLFYFLLPIVLKDS